MTKQERDMVYSMSDEQLLDAIVRQGEKVDKVRGYKSGMRRKEFKELFEFTGRDNMIGMFIQTQVQFGFKEV